MARAGMANLIRQLRVNAAAGDTDENVNGVLYWTDDQLEDILDRWSTDVNDVELVKYSRMESGVTVWKQYYLPASVPINLEDSATTGEFTVVDSLGNTITGYTFDLARRKFVFSTDQAGRTYYLRARAYDLNQATAEVWTKKASLRADLIDWKAGTYNLKEDQIYQHALKEAARWAGKSGFSRIQLYRDDYANSYE
jgi:hypothetical protein